jgi:iron uptake system component EfeO
MRKLLVATALFGLAACGKGPSPGTGSIEVKATDTACEVSRTTADVGAIVFTVKNAGAKTTEFYVYAPGDRVMGEVENISPGVSRDLRVNLQPGTYETACKPGMAGKGIRGAFHVTGSATAISADAKLTAATESYQRYIKTQSDALLVKTQEFVDAVKAGDPATAKALYPIARTYWERIEPVAEIFGDLDPKIDGREDEEPFTGFHRLERDLWRDNDISRSGPIADQLMADVRAIVEKANAEKLTAVQLANGAKELLDEVATGKITGEEDRYSHTDLWDFAANVEGSKAAVQALRPVLEERSPALVSQLDSAFATVDTTLGKHRAGDGWRLHHTLSQAELKELADVINAVAEPISKVAAVVAK